MHTAAVKLNDKIGLWLPYASVQHKLSFKRAALNVLEDKIEEGEKEHGLLVHKARQTVFEYVY